MAKLPRQVKTCLLEDSKKPALETGSESDSDQSRSAKWLRCTALGTGAMLLFGAHHAAGVEDSG